MPAIDPWTFLFGLGLFLFGMQQLESALKSLTGPTFKRFLRDTTNTPLKGILGGTVATAVMQSSSLVSLLMLAFVGAGVLPLAHAIGVIIGANLGTTVTGWLVASLGFKLSLGDLSLPLIATGSVCMFWFRNSARLHAYSQLVLALGFILFGLDQMKAAMQAVATSFDVSTLVGQPAIVFALAGLLFTAVVQSSSAAMAITLSALSAGIIDLPAGAALVIGADLGTTITVIIGASGGTPDQKRVASSHVLFNLVTDVAAFLLLLPALTWLYHNGSLGDPIVAVVAFHSTFNLLGIALFLPWIKRFGAFLERRFQHQRTSVARYLRDLPEGVPEVAVRGLGLELWSMYRDAIELCAETTQRFVSQHSMDDETFFARYRQIKLREAEILSFTYRLQREPLPSEISEQVMSAVLTTRNLVHAVKSVRDVRHDAQELADAKPDALLQAVVAVVESYASTLDSLKAKRLSRTETARLRDLASDLPKQHVDLVQKIYAVVPNAEEQGDLVSTLLNVNRELLQACMALVDAAEEMTAILGVAHNNTTTPSPSSAAVDGV
ncbi:MAG: hypothetical protein DHS20C11_10940 [Lysobacteraceae bacterium]|nr:MAG: hypothetical protein DHS20C11_10940 [Xanthomonadaceae bacterium]